MWPTTDLAQAKSPRLGERSTLAQAAGSRLGKRSTLAQAAGSRLGLSLKTQFARLSEYSSKTPGRVSATLA